MREFTYLADGGASVEGEGHLHKPWGFSGGKDGACAELELEDGMGGTIQMPSKMPSKMVKTDHCVAKMYLMASNQEWCSISTNTVHQN